MPFCRWPQAALSNRRTSHNTRAHSSQTRLPLQPQHPKKSRDAFQNKRPRDCASHAENCGGPGPSSADKAQRVGSTTEFHAAPSSSAAVQIQMETTDCAGHSGLIGKLTDRWIS
ncbi:hypothetical protein M407DRAFT_34124 [Tulasnella calospora MUT 4182]|uniref:Uncharacterized protein n=1 Tax=Tulasnella calospora MUT 4182 TaxID=1051891 RepID=A0A0C3Q146_9AGAM|nr:hypothetical protein M407DRAFT_34124 [Tulasnella calospora MUT 4182]